MAATKLSEAWYLGLDIGTSSVGWAVTDEHYNIPRLRGQRAWGVRLFDEAQTAADRRLRRGARRRYFRRAERLKYLRQMFKPLIEPIDSGFFQRMKDSFFWSEDKQQEQCNSLFNDPDYTDKDYFFDFPTIFHLRKYLMEYDSNNPGYAYGDDDKKPKIDARHYYLACHHIVKYRGHFLFEGEKDIGGAEAQAKFNELFTKLQDELSEIFGFKFKDNFCSLLFDQLSVKKTLTDKKAAVKDIGITVEIQENEERQKEVLQCAKAIREFLVGSSLDILKLMETDVKKKIQLGVGDVDAKIADISAECGSQLEGLLTYANQMFDIGVARQILGEADSLSDAYIKLYQEIGATNPENNRSELDLYNCSEPIPKEKQMHKLTIPRLNEDKEEKTIKKPKLRGYFKGAVPMQYNLSELRKILMGLEKSYPEFANQQTVFKDDCAQVKDSEKVVKLLTHRVPYYVGPLKTEQNEHETAKTDRQKPWMKRNVGKEAYKIYPWNFDEVVDKATSAAAFIQRMTNKCTYLHDEPCLPKDSVLYQKYLVLNELNKMKIEGNSIDVQTKQALFNELFLATSKITLKNIKEWCVTKGFSAQVSIADSEGTGGTINHKMTSYLLFKDIFDERTDVLLPKIEKAILYIILLPDDREMLKHQLREVFKNEQLEDSVISRIAGFNFSKWGNLSSKLLDGITVQIDGSDKTIVDLLWETNENFMQIYHDLFTKQIQEHLERTSTHKDDDAFIDESYASVPVKRSARQAIRIVRELEEVIGSKPAKVFIEAPRSKGESKRTVSRKKDLEDLYKGVKTDVAEELHATENQNLKPKRIYLYFLQEGKCAYSGEKLSLGDLSSECQIDHIVPQSLLKDDSFDNLVLVKNAYNQKKKDIYPINLVEGIDFDQRLTMWRRWHKQGLMSDKKLKSLSRTTLSIDEIAGFINRQLVETSQTTKMVMDILKRVMPDTEVIYQKAETVSEFKREWAEYEGTFEGPTDNKRFVPARDEDGNKIVRSIIKPHYIKIREMNDLHHAKDAYLNIVVGNVYACRFTNNPRQWLKKELGDNPYAKRKWNMTKVMYDDKNREVKKIADPATGEIIWDSEHLTSVNNTMERNDILVTVRTYVAASNFFNEMPVKAKQKIVPLKKRFRDTQKYGGYDSMKPAQVALVSRLKGKKQVIDFARIPSMHVTDSEKYLKSSSNNVKVMQLIPLGSLLKINNQPMLITGIDASDNVELYSAKQFIVSDEAYLKRIINAVEKSDYSQLSAQQNEEMFDEIVGVLSNHYRELPGNKLLKSLQEGSFVSAPIEIQAKSIIQILNHFNRKTCNLKDIGGSPEHRYRRTYSSLGSEIRLVVQSVTGLFSHEIDLSSL